MSGAGASSMIFLVAALHRAVAFAQIHRIAVGVGQHLDLDVARILEELLHVDHRVAEGSSGFGTRHVDRVDQRSLGVHHAHAAPAAAASGLDDDRVADAARRCLMISFGSSGRAPSEPGTQGTPAAFIASLALTLSPIRRMVSGRGPMNTKPLFSTRSPKSAFSDRKP
jgi:hypothetical protein